MNKPSPFGYSGPRRRSRHRWIVTAVVAACSSVAPAANYYWDPAASATGTGSGGTGTWNTTATNWFLGSGADVVWPNTTANTSDFSGAAGTVTLGSAITTGGLIFDTAGYTLNTGSFTFSLGTGGITSNPASGTTTIGGAITSLGSQTWTTAAGGTLSMGATYSSATATNYNLTLTGAGTVNLTGGSSATPDVVTGVFTAGGGSTVNVTGYFNTTSSTLANTKFTVNGGSTVNWSGTGTQSGIYNGVADGSAGTLNVTAGAFTSSPTSATFVGNGAAGLLNVSGGLATIGSSTAVYIGDGYNGSGSAGSGTITIGGGQFTTGTTTGSFVLGSSSLAGTGTINLNGGTFSSNRAFTGTAGKAAINFNGGTLQATGTALALANTITTTIQDNGGTIDTQANAVTLAANFTHGGVAATDGGLTKIGSGALTLSGTGSFNGATTLNAGSLTLIGTTDVGSSGISVNAGSLTLGNNSTNGQNALTSSNSVTLASGTSLIINQTNTPLTYAAFPITLNGSSNITFAGGNSYADTIASPITLNNTGAAGSQFATIGETDAANSVNFTGSISGTGDLMIAPVGNGNFFTVTFGQAESYSGNTTVTQTGTGDYSVLKLGTNGSLPSTTILTLNQSGTSRSVQFNLNGMNQTVAGLATGGGAGVGSTQVNGGGTLTINDTAAYTFAGAIAGATTAVIKSANGNETLTGVNSYAGTTTVNAGVLTLTGANTITGAITVNGGELYAQSTANTPLNTAAVTVVSGGNVTVGDHAGSVPNMTNNWTLNGAGTSISSNTTNGTIGAGALGFYNSGNFSLTGTINLASSAVIYDNPVTQTTPLSFSGVISGAGGLTLAGGSSSTGTPYFILGTANTYGTAAATTVLTNGGSTQQRVELSTVDNVLPTNTVVTFGGTPTGQGGTYNGPVSLMMDGIHQTIAGLTTSGSGTFSIVGNSATGSTLTVNNANASSFGGTLGGAATNANNLALAKTGTGTLALSGTNTYAGGTLVSAGTLAANNATSSLGSGSTSVNGTGVLAGTGKTGGAVTVGDGNATDGTITAGSGATAGDTISTLNTGTQTWNNGGTFVAKVAANGGTVTGNDELVMSGLTPLAGGAVFNVSVIGLTANAATATFGVGQSIVLAQDNTSATTNPFVISQLMLMTSNVQPTGTGSLSLQTFADTGGYDLVLADTNAAPEPTSAILLGMTALPMMMERRRRRRLAYAC